MKKILSLILTVCIILTMLPNIVLAASPVNIFNITVTAPEVGKKPAYDAKVPDTASTYVTKTEWSGTLDSDGCFKSGTEYTVNVYVRLKDGQDKYIKEVSDTIKVNGKIAKMKKISDDKKEAIISYTFKTSKEGLTTQQKNDPKAIKEISVTLGNYALGVNEKNVTLAISDDRFEQKNLHIKGTFGEGDTLIEGKQYTITSIFRLKNGVDAYIPEGFSKANVTVKGVNATVNSATVTGGNLLSITITPDKFVSAETLAKETEEKANEHRHCYCGGYVDNSGDHTSHQDVVYQKWPGEGNIKYTNGVTYIYLDKDVDLDNSLNIGGGKTLYLCLNGHALGMKYRGQRVINVSVNGKLYLCNCTRSAGGKITKGNAEYGAGIHNNGTVRMFGGVITENEGGYGGGVYNNVNFYLYGGDIYNNSAIHGGGVWNDNDSSSTFTMYNGTISMNTASCGGGIYNNDGATLVLKGGHISENASGSAGGGIWNNGGNVELNGAMILANASTNGAGVWNNGGGLFSFISGNISKNVGVNDPNINHYAFGGGVWNNDDAIFNMTGGEITFNKATQGGGVWCNNGSEFVMAGGVMAENEAINGAGIFIDKSDDNAKPGVFRMSNYAGIGLNYASGLGGGAHVKGILYMDDTVEISGNSAGTPDNIDIYVDPSGSIIKNAVKTIHFIDVKEEDYFIDPVKWALEKNITSGTSDITFSPNDTCNTAQILTFLWRAAGKPEAKTKPLIADVYEDDYYYMPAYWAQSLGIFEKALYPNYSCNRGSAVYYMWCAAGKPEVNETLPFTDVKADSPFYTAIAWALEKGVTSGTTPTTFEPGKTCTRAQIITFLYRAYK